MHRALTVAGSSNFLLKLWKEAAGTAALCHPWVLLPHADIIRSSQLLYSISIWYSVKKGEEQATVTLTFIGHWRVYLTWLRDFKNYLVRVYMCVHMFACVSRMCVREHITTVQVRGSEENFQEHVLPSHHAEAEFLLFLMLCPTGLCDSRGFSCLAPTSPQEC